MTTLNLNGVPPLLAALERSGCTVTHAEAYRAVISLPSPTAPPAPEDVLGATVKELTKNLVDVASFDGQSAAVARRRAAMIDRATRQLADSMAAEADDYVRALRPAWDAAAQAARDVRDHGIQPADTAEQIMARGAEASTAWLQFRELHSPTLERIAGLRTQLAAIGVAPGPGYDVSIALTRPHLVNLYPGDRRANEPAHVKWLRAAPDLHLCTSDELDPDAVLTVQGEDVGQLKAVARARLNAQNRN